MNLFLDTEFNGFAGELISMALVPQFDGIGYQEFYREVEFFKKPDPWVAENVIPKLNLAPITPQQFQAELLHFLNQCEALSKPLTIIADYPDDICYFCETMITGPGTRIAFDRLNFRLDCTLQGVSKLPHHALYDARGIRDAYVRGNP